MYVTQALKVSAYKENPFSKCIFKIPPFLINYMLFLFNLYAVTFVPAPNSFGALCNERVGLI